jgi:hypothetical protein
VPNKFGANMQRWSRQRCATASRRLAALRRPAVVAVVAARATHVRNAAGAVAVLLVTLDETTRPAVNSAFNPRMTMQPTAPATASTLPAGAAISRAAAAKLFGQPIDQIAVGTAGQPVSGSWNYEWHQSKTPGRNVIAIMPGSDPARASEYVLVGAHNDHVGVNATSVDHDSLARGEQGHASAGRQRSVVPTHRGAATHDRLAHRLRAPHPRATARLDHERRGRRRLRHAP